MVVMLFPAKFCGKTELVHRSRGVSFPAKLSEEPEFLCRSRDVRSGDVNFSAKYSGKTKLVHRSRDVSFPAKFREETVPFTPTLSKSGPLAAAVVKREHGVNESRVSVWTDLDASV